jgi:hypothetical protein
MYVRPRGYPWLEVPPLRHSFLVIHTQLPTVVMQDVRERLAPLPPEPHTITPLTVTLPVPVSWVQTQDCLDEQAGQHVG